MVASLWTFRRLRLGPKPDSAGRTIPSRPSSALTLSNFFRSAAVVTCLPVGAKGMPDANRGRGEGLLQSRESQIFFRQGKAITPCERTIGRGDLLVHEQYQSNMRGIGRTINKGSCIFIYKRPRPYQFGPVRRYRPLATRPATTPTACQAFNYLFGEFPPPAWHRLANSIIPPCSSFLSVFRRFRAGDM